MLLYARGLVKVWSKMNWVGCPYLWVEVGDASYSKAKSLALIKSVVRKLNVWMKSLLPVEGQQGLNVKV